MNVSKNSQTHNSEIGAKENDKEMSKEIQK